ncbi:hypothetical protein AB0900_31330 [Streptomyces cellulosae]
MADAQQLINTATHLLNRDGISPVREEYLREAEVRASLAQADALDRIAHALTRLADHETTPAVHPAA